MDRFSRISVKRPLQGVPLNTAHFRGLEESARALVNAGLRNKRVRLLIKESIKLGAQSRFPHKRGKEWNVCSAAHKTHFTRKCAFFAVRDHSLVLKKQEPRLESREAKRGKELLIVLKRPDVTRNKIDCSTLVHFNRASAASINGMSSGLSRSKLSSALMMNGNVFSPSNRGSVMQLSACMM